MAPYDLLAKYERLTLLYCYAAEDQEALTLLEPYLRTFMNERVQIKSLNMNVASLQLVESSVQISEAHIILLLVSDAFKRFGDGKNDVMEYILRRERHQETRVFPVVLRKTRWTGTIFNMLRPLPTNNKPLQSDKGVLDQNLKMFLRELQAEIDKLLGPIEATAHSGEAHESSPPVQDAMGNGQIQALAEAEVKSELSTDPVKLPSPTQSTRFDDDEEDTITIRHKIHPSWHGSRSMETDERRRLLRRRFQRNAPKVVIVVVVMCLAFGLFFFVVPGREAPIPPTQERNGIGVHMLGGEPIGISDGTIIFDTNRSNAEAKKLAAEALLRGDIGKAEQQWGASVEYT